MELRSALLFIGIIVIVIVAVLTFRKANRMPFSIKLGKQGTGRRFRNREFAGDEIDPLFAPSHSVDEVEQQAGTARHDQPHEAEMSDVATNSDSENTLSPADTGAKLQADAGDSLQPAPLEIDSYEPEPQASMDLQLEPLQQEQDHVPEKAIDYVALIRGAESIGRDQALGIYRQHEYQMDKASFIYGFNIASGLWRDLELEPQEGKYRDICLAIQIVDSNGAIDESELNRFSQMSLAVAEELDRPIIFSMDFDEALAYARELDRFCGECDIVIIVSMVARNERGISLRAIHREAAKISLMYNKHGIYQHIRKDAAGHTEVLYSLANMYQPGSLPKDDSDTHTSGLTMFMKVATISDPVAVFSDMIEKAALLAKRLNAILVDQETRPLSDDGIKVIHKRITDLVAEMETRGITPGSQLARRLFN
jgi:FtsZ-interacting cell division protein ZipA